MKILHQLSLDTLGGVERLFAAYVQKVFDPDKHLLCLTNRGIHPMLNSSVIQGCSSQYGLKQIGPIVIPKFLRAHRMRYIVSRSSAELMVSWNRLTDDFAQFAPTIYYDHGAGWTVPVSKKILAQLNRCEKIVTCSYASKRVIELRWGVRPSVEVVSNPVRHDLDLRRARERKLPEGRGVKLGMMGRMVPLKGFSLGIHALSRLLKQGMDVELLIAGCGPLREQLERLASILGVVSNVRFCGVIPAESFLDQIDLMLVPSLKDAMPLAALEAMGLGCPVIAPDVDGFREILGDGLLTPELSVQEYGLLGGCNGPLPDVVYDPAADQLVSPRALSPSQLADTVESLLCDKQLYETRSAAGIVKAKTQHNFDRYCNELNSILL